RKQMAARITAVNEIALDKRDVETRLSPKAYLRLTKRGALPRDFAKAKFPNLEGFLFPATYSFTKNTTTRGLVNMQLDAFTNAWAGVDLKYAESKNLNAYDVLIIASMVEKEVQVPKERRLVAAVIYNRLKAGIALGIDATIRYGLNIPPTKAILESQLNSDSPYNTRKFIGLPPRPIANPGLASIQAAAHPAKVNYTFFIRKPDCRSHYFTASQEEFDNYSREGLNC
ncbi:MAG TPA: endolytic transglycosylase MltG, partial [Gaiellaceae bacterium]|nr:endolytic transglycosylase MltG [Gaiellaceae bacterium]